MNFFNLGKSSCTRSIHLNPCINFSPSKFNSKSASIQKTIKNTFSSKIPSHDSFALTSIPKSFGNTSIPFSNSFPFKNSIPFSNNSDQNQKKYSTDNKPPKQKAKKKHIGLITTLTLFGGFYAYDKFVNYSAVERSIRTLFYTALVATDYWWNFTDGKTKSELEALHSRTAKRILWVCQKNGGIYIKFGQGIGLQGSVLPPQFRKELSLLYDKAPTISKEDVHSVLSSSFPGKNIDDLFIDFSYEPVASASIAQVHKARLRSNPDQYVAIKIQKPAIKKQMEFDFFVYRQWCRLVEYRFGFPLMWSVPYTEKHFRMETDFEQEGRNAELAMQVINTDKELRENAYVPKVFWDYTTKSVLVTEWIDGYNLIHPEKLADAGFNLTSIMDIIVKMFSQQLFVSGHLHGDPHHGNIIVRKNPDKKINRQQVVLLDHGLYINESETFRKQYCQFWKSIFLQDKDKMEKIASAWGIKNSEFLSSIVMIRPPDSHIKTVRKGLGRPSKNNSTKNIPTKNQNETSEYEQQMSAKDVAIQFFSDSSLLPPELVFVMRNMNMVRSNNKALGSPVNRIKIMANSAAVGASIDNDIDYDTNKVYKLVEKHKVLSSFNSPEPKNYNGDNGVIIKKTGNLGILKRLFVIETRQIYELWRFKFSVFILDTLFFYTKIKAKIIGWVTGNKSRTLGNFEVVVDQAMLATMEEKLGYKVDPDIFNG
ncbi:hypothetical protein BB559_005372 [Furculomyces boomerangus]|uniref:ABC1 atypical kinase-like domain-containing protein n=2 Tax=Harpellales TaxID=61421 RepID=A0A2T9Y908_9FUNG|nr:hypothetical protein BB559_005372 [Furculomyces boomerangus]PWA01929.1 hypothetical protein BB558_001960 [Smittium angustum]